MKRLGVFFLFVFFVAIVSAASFEVHNISIDTSYPYNQNLKGTMNVSFTDVPADTVFWTNKNQSVLLMDILNANGFADSFCDPYGCSTKYDILGEVSSLEFDLGLGEDVFWGFSLTGERVNILDLSFEMESDFSESENVPLIMNFLESPEDAYYNEYSNLDYREPYYGCYKSSSRVLGPKIGSTTYCSKIATYETDRLIVGADVSLEGASGQNLTMTLFDPDLPGGGRSCSYDPSGSYNYCSIDFSESDLLEASTYYLCVGAEEGSVDYKLYMDESSKNYCGFSYTGNQLNTSAALSPNKTKNYAFFLQEAIYADASGLADYNFSALDGALNAFISWKYRNDCSGGCVFPIKLRAGVPQQIGVKNFSVSYYIEDDGEYDKFNISELSVEYALMDFSGVLDFDYLGILMNETGNYEFYVGDSSILNETIRITPAPIIEGIFPVTVPAGINVKITADIDYDNPNASLSYLWNFGDGSSQTTTVPEVYHLFSNITEYEVQVTVTAGNLTNSRKQVITTISPKNYVSLIYGQVGVNLNNTLNNISRFPAWQQRVLEKSLDIMTYQDKLSRIGHKINEAFDDADYLEIAGMLVDLDVPKKVFISEEYSFDFSPGEDINLAAIEEYTSESADEGPESDYIDAIVRWQDNNVAFSTTVKKVSLEKTSGSVYDIFVTYLIRVTVDSDDQSFLVLN
ncbi:MAG: PKD domain-containing protein, partial [Bacteroidetes bacterium]|nr:PKD domain-containing protein [Bacteroidota bacterium]